VLKYVARSIFAFAVRSASHVYAVSEPMARWLRSEFDVDSTIQMPAGELPRDVSPSDPEGKFHDERVVRLAFAGTCAAADETLKLLAGIIRTCRRLPDGRRLELHLYMPRPQFEPVWDHDRIVLHPWLSQSDLRAALRRADILFLPYNFSESDNYVPARSFPTKASDYMCSGRPILVMAPAFAAIVRYARDYGFAEIVDQFSQEMLLDAIYRLATDHRYQSILSERALQVFKANHEIGVQRQEVSLMIERLAGSQI
jgi:glycosyltransferase involved in cell wall biosynthesis